MENSEIHLRIKQIIERVQAINKSLSEISKLKEITSVQKKKDFLGPHEIDGDEKHWKNFCVSSRRQLYGLNQKIMLVKRVQLKIKAMDVAMLRLISQASLNSSQLLRGLLQFPSKLQSKSDEKDPSDVAAKVVMASKHLLLLLQQLGFVSAVVQDADKRTDDESLGTSIEDVESSVVEELLERGTISRHLARMAKLRLDSGKSSAPAVKSVLLPRGRQMVLVEDSLSHLIGRQRHSGRPPKTNASAGVVSVATNVRPTRRERSRRRRHRSEPQRRSSRSQPRRLKTPDRDDEGQRHLLWQQLLPLLLNQEVLELNAAENDLPRHLRKLDDILQRLDNMQVSAEYNLALQSECERLEVVADRSGDSLGSVIQKARNLLQRSGFLPPDSVGVYLHSDSGEVGSGSHVESAKENFAHNSDILSDIEKRRESFWASLAEEGYVGA